MKTNTFAVSLPPPRLKQAGFASEKEALLFAKNTIPVPKGKNPSKYLKAFIIPVVKIERAEEVVVRSVPKKQPRRIRFKDTSFIDAY